MGVTELSDVAKRNDKILTINVLPELVRKFRLIQDAAYVLGFKIVPVQGYRSLEDQKALYAQGRDPEHPGSIVTYAKPGASAHNYGLAIDFAFLTGNQPDWNERLPWETIGSMGEALELVWGGRWIKLKDRPHLEVFNWREKKDWRM